MLESVYIGLSGLMTSQKGLSNISTNVANLNTPGFKGNQLLFEDLLYNQQNLGGNGSGNNTVSLGSGVDIGGTSVLFRQGTLNQTGNDQDAAITGNGFFILTKDGKTFYTRAGQFQFDANGYLVSRTDGARVSVLNSGGTQLQDLNISNSRVSPPQATTLISLSGTLTTNDTNLANNAISSINAFGSDGRNSPLKIVFTDNSTVTPSSWTFAITDQAANAVANGTVVFQGDGSPNLATSNFSFTYTPSGGSAQNITINFGKPGSFSGINNFSTSTSSIKVLSSDGFAPGSISKITYDDQGQVILNYSNGQTATLNKLALAWFDFLPGLKQEGGNHFINDTDQKPIIGAAKTSVFGTITGGSIEASNVDLSQQFSELIVIQRAYQSSSQVVTAANEMMQQALDLKGRR